MKGVMIIEDTHGGSARAMSILGVPNIAAMQNIANSLQDWTTGRIRSISFTETQDLNLEGAAFGRDKFDMCRQKAVMTFRDMDAPSTESPTITIEWPAPRDDMFFADRGVMKVRQLDGDTFATVIGQRIGRNLIFLFGELKQV